MTTDETPEIEPFDGTIDLLDGRELRLDRLLQRRIATHRLTAEEIASGSVLATPDLDHLILLVDLEPYDVGVELDETDLDAPRLRFTGDAIAGLGARPGDLLGVRVGPLGLEPELVTEPVDDGADLGERLVALLLQHSEHEPVPLQDLVWQACATDADVLKKATVPLGEVLADARIQHDGGEVALPEVDLVVWRRTVHREEIEDDYGLQPDEAEAVLLLLERFTLPDEEPDAERLALLELLAEPAVADAAAAEVTGLAEPTPEQVAAVEKRLAPRLGRLARANLRWLHACVLELAGDPRAAEQTLRSALDLDDRCPLALEDLAAFAADRDDVEQALALLFEAETTEDDPLRIVLERHRPAQRRDVGRNDPCWCGSGRKFKSCHLGRVQRSDADRTDLLLGRLAVFAARIGHEGDPTAPDLAVLDAYRTRRGPLLSDADAALVERWRQDALDEG
ncbi:SEC-C domain-containing protein [Nocardioides sp. TRM66260-LWL]|uniref:YecA family protein n=1 Tax=Nocardioides sp. TRM66260-LWL TaxID=2874478 RepID=UPI001CC6EBA3|nr:SEC-C metal-binding domain-containing protein [Nocardioides sp. TRM66260-LWL]MBZ5733466.1 SEC-C domain-containing protein [Nocardioides sp. TRM66260-LWL]